jgi:hypothetical protein
LPKNEKEIQEKLYIDAKIGENHWLTIIILKLKLFATV